MNWDNASDVALILCAVSAIRLLTLYFARRHRAPIKDELSASVAALMMAALFFGIAYALHARHAAYYLLLGWCAEGSQSVLGRSKYVWTIVFGAYGTVCIVLLNTLWIIIAAWAAGAIAFAVLSVGIMKKVRQRDT